MDTGARLPAPGDRNRAVDLVRVLALLGVVVGHWLKQGWWVDDGGTLHRAGLLAVAPWTHPLTWVFQVMPLFFLVGGYVNALSWRHAVARGEPYATWLSGRLRRLTAPLVPLLALWCVLLPVAPVLGLEQDRWLRIASDSSLTLTWFLAVYVVVVALVPLSLAAWDRWGAWTLVVGLAAVPVDVVSVQLDSVPAGAPNLLLVWGTLHQLGYAWADGVLAGRRRAGLVAVGGLLGAVALVAAGPYALSMVGVEGYGVSNTVPPRATLLALGVGMAGVVVALEPWLQRWAERPRVWGVVAGTESHVMTIYLWHLTAFGLLAALSLPLGGIGLHARPATLEWWALRPLWFAALALATWGLVAAFGRFEAPRPRSAALRSPALPLLEVVLVSGLVGLLADRGLGAGEAGGSPQLLLAAAFLGIVVVDRLQRRTSLSQPAGAGAPGPSPPA